MKMLSLAVVLVLNATQGHTEAAYNADFVHELRLLGRGHEAFQYALTWAGSGDADAELEVIYSLLDGKGVEPDPLAAMAFACGPRQVNQFNIEKVLIVGNLRLSGTGIAVVRCEDLHEGQWI
jgi:hypothetical protein